MERKPGVRHFPGCPISAFNAPFTRTVAKEQRRSSQCGDCVAECLPRLTFQGGFRALFTTTWQPPRHVPRGLAPSGPFVCEWLPSASCVDFVHNNARAHCDRPWWITRAFANAPLRLHPCDSCSTGSIKASASRRAVWTWHQTTGVS